MKITEINSYSVLVGMRNQLLVKIETDEGIYGWGECGLANRHLAVQGVKVEKTASYTTVDP